MTQRQMLHQSRHGGGLGTVLLHEFQPGRGVVKEVRHPDGGALRGALLPDGLHVPALTMNGGTYGILRPSGQHVYPADGGNSRQSFTPEAKGPDLGQILRRAELTGGVAQKGGGQLLRRNAAAVVCHPDQAHAAPLDLHHNGGGSGVDGVFHQLLHNRGGALHHLAGGDQVGHMRR